MKKCRFGRHQPIGILSEARSDRSVNAVCAKHNVSEPTYYSGEAKVWRHRVEGGTSAQGL